MDRCICVIPYSISCLESINLYGELVEFVAGYQKRFYRHEGDRHSEIFDLRDYSYDRRPRIIDENGNTKESVMWVLGYYCHVNDYCTTEFMAYTEDDRNSVEHYYTWSLNSMFTLWKQEEVSYKYAKKRLLECKFEYKYGRTLKLDHPIII